MRAGARHLIGEHDFSSFCRRGDGSLVRRVRSIRIAKTGDEIVFTVAADSFCHQMVRSIVGSLLEVGGGRRSAAQVGKALKARDRAVAGAVAPARGLHLVRVDYARNPFPA